jgi:HAD superfamily hydrolase (TIGR01509 family)
MFQAVIFDNDGVLVDSEPLHHRAEAATMRHFGAEINADDFKAYVGLSMAKMLGDWIDKFKIKASIEEMIRFHEANLQNIFQEEVQPTPHVLPLVHHLRQKNYLLAVASSSTRALVELGLRKLGILSLFNSVLCGDEISHLKPDPSIYLKTADRLQVAPANCLVIEDSHVGVIAAKAAGMFCVGYRNANSGNQDLSLADLIISDFRDLTRNPAFQL